ncbi:MAG: aminoglycoside phosphotransferase family protein [Holosporaceae bacterium]
MLQKHFQPYLDRWHLTPDGRPFETVTSFILFVKRHKTTCVLKVFKPDSDEKFSGDALQLYNGEGVVTCLAKDPNALLLKRVKPASPLTEYSLNGQDDKATLIFCEVLKKLHRAKKQTTLFQRMPSISVWGHGFETFADDALGAQLSSTLIGDAKTLFFDLVAAQSEAVLLHADLHHDNILYDAHKGWLALDPKGFRGEQEIDASAYFKNPTHDGFCIQQAFERRLLTLQKELSFDAHKMIAWCYTLTVLSCLWLLQLPKPQKEETQRRFQKWCAFALFLKERL